MTIPYREWTAFHSATLRGEDVANSFITAADWTNNHYETCMIGLSKTFVAGIYIRRDPLFKPDDSNFKLMTSLDHIWKVKFDILFALEVDDYVGSWIGPYGTLNSAIHPEQWDPELVTGKNYDGINNWSNYPLGCWGTWGNVTITPADFPKSYEFWLASYANGALRCYPYQTGFFRNGLHLSMANMAGGLPDNGESFLAHLIPQSVKVYYANAVVNSLSTYRSLTAGGGQLVINGLGFDCDDDEIAEDGAYCGAACAAPGVGFNDEVDEIYFVPLRGQAVPAALTSPADFIINSNEKITIADLPAMEAGPYSIMLRKINVGPAAQLGTIDSYAGDFVCATDGRTREGRRFVLLVSDEEEEEDDPPNPRTKWRWGEHDGEVFAHYSYLDTKGRDTFWEGRIKNMSPMTRAIDDRVGLFAISDVSVTLANQDKEMSKMLSRYFLRNKLVDFYYGLGREAEAWDEHYFQGVVIDHDLIGTHFEVKVRDVTQKYFGMSTSQYICTLEEYPFIHESAIGKGMPDALGLCGLIPTVADENSGAIEARYVDTRVGVYSYLAARFSLTGITEVYSNNVEINVANYTVVYRDGGRTYIDFDNNQGNNKITFNCTGYSVGMWDDPTNGYIQNPAYVISFFLTQIVSMPLALLDMESFDDYAALCTTNGWHREAKLILQDGRDAMEVLKELLYSFGANLWIAKDGRLTIGRKDIANFATDLVIFQQIHAFEHAKREYNLQDFVNAANTQWDYIPTHSTFKKAEEISSPRSIEDYGKERYPSTPWHFPWLVSDISADGEAQDLAAQRMREELLKYDYGYKKIHIKVPIQMIDDLDIFTNFRYQDPFGLSWTKEGEKGRYYYISSLTYDFQSRSIDVVGIDLQYLLEQYFILGDENALSCNYSTASEAQRMYGHLADELTGRFAGGNPCKKLCDENVL